MTTVKAIKGATSVRAAPRQALAATQQVPTRRGGRGVGESGVGGPGDQGSRGPGVNAIKDF